MSSVGEQFPVEQARLRNLIAQYHSIGPAGGFGAMMIEQTLAEADAAMASGDVVEIVKAFAAMQECK